MNTNRNPRTSYLARTPAGFVERVSSDDTRKALAEYQGLYASFGQSRGQVAELERARQAVAVEQRKAEIAAVRKDATAVPAIKLVQEHEEKIAAATRLRDIRRGALADAQRDLLALLERDEAAHAASVDGSIAEATQEIRSALERLAGQFAALDDLRGMRSWIGDPYGGGRSPALVVPDSHGSRMRGGQAPAHAIAMLGRALEDGPAEADEEPSATEPAEAKPPAPRHRALIPVGIIV